MYVLPLLLSIYVDYSSVVCVNLRLEGSVAAAVDLYELGKSI